MKSALLGLALLAFVGCSRTGDHTDTTGPMTNPVYTGATPSPDPSGTPNTIPAVRQH